MYHPNELDQQIENLRTLQESYDVLASEVKGAKTEIVAAINAMGGTATASMSMGELAQAIRALILVQLGELEYNIPVENAEEALNLASVHCTKYVNDYTTQMYAPLIVDEWQAVEEVRYKKLLNYNFDLFSSDERKTGVYALTLCHNLKKVVFDSLLSISLKDRTSQFIGSNIRLEEVNMPSLTSISGTSSKILSSLSSLTTLSLPSLTSISSSNDSSSGNSSQILSGLSSLTTLSLPSLTSISIYSRGGYVTSQILSGLSSLTTLILPSLTSISSVSGSYSHESQILSGLSSLTYLSLPAITNISGSSYKDSTSQILSDCVNLEYIEIGYTDAYGYGSITENMFYNINPTNIYDNAEKLTALNASIREHWFANLRDYTGGTAHTLTLMSAFVAHLEPETIQVATDKNWTIVTF